MWLFIALLAPIFYAVSNILDSFLTNKNFKSIWALTFYSSFFPILFLPIIFIFYDFSLPPISSIPVLIIVGLVNILYLYPYFKGLQNDDTSTAVAFFGLGRIFIPIWAFMLIGEKLQFNQYLGIIFIITGCIALSFKGKIENRIKFSKSILYILLAAFITSFEGVLLKYLFNENLSVGMGMATEIVFSFLLSLLLLFNKKTRLVIKNNFSIFKKNLLVFSLEEGATFVAFFFGTYVLTIAPVSLARSISALTPIFVLIYAKIFSKKYPQLFAEQKGFLIDIKKISMFLVIFIGIIMILK